MNLTNEQKGFFTKLAQRREIEADAFDEHGGIERMLTENKYSDKAHFIYELLQNADDVKASKIRFKLSKSGAHLGLRGKWYSIDTIIGDMVGL